VPPAALAAEIFGVLHLIVLTYLGKASHKLGQNKKIKESDDTPWVLTFFWVL
jgi:hypothetical protein